MKKRYYKVPLLTLYFSGMTFAACMAFILSRDRKVSFNVNALNLAVLVSSVLLLVSLAALAAYKIADSKDKVIKGVYNHQSVLAYASSGNSLEPVFNNEAMSKLDNKGCMIIENHQVGKLVGNNFYYKCSNNKENFSTFSSVMMTLFAFSSIFVVGCSAWMIGSNNTVGLSQMNPFAKLVDYSNPLVVVNYLAFVVAVASLAIWAIKNLFEEKQSGALADSSILGINERPKLSY